MWLINGSSFLGLSTLLGIAFCVFSQVALGRNSVSECHAAGRIFIGYSWAPGTVLVHSSHPVTV